MVFRVGDYTTGCLLLGRAEKIVSVIEWAALFEHYNYNFSIKLYGQVVICE